jgi:hypothetical protein
MKVTVSIEVEVLALAGNATQKWNTAKTEFLAARRELSFAFQAAATAARDECGQVLNAVTLDGQQFVRIEWKCTSPEYSPGGKYGTGVRNFGYTAEYGEGPSGRSWPMTLGECREQTAKMQAWAALARPLVEAALLK